MLWINSLILVLVVLIIIGFVYYQERGNNKTNNYLVIMITIILFIFGSLIVYKNIQYVEPVNLNPNNIEKIQQHIKNNPEDAEAYQMLGAAYSLNNDLEQAINSYSQSYNLGNRDVDLLVEYASVLASQNNGDFAGLPSQLLAEAIVLEPESIKALYLSGIVAANNNDLIMAKNIWQKALGLSEPNSRDYVILSEILAQLEEVITQPAEKNIEVIVDIDQDIYKEFFDGFIFIYAQQPEQLMPIAIERIALRDFIGLVVLNNSNSMLPNRSLSTFDKVIIKARLSKTGSASRQGDDIEVASKLIDVKNRIVELKIAK